MAASADRLDELIHSALRYSQRELEADLLTKDKTLPETLEHIFEQQGGVITSIWRAKLLVVREAIDAGTDIIAVDESIDSRELQEKIPNRLATNFTPPIVIFEAKKETGNIEPLAAILSEGLHVPSISGRRRMQLLVYHESAVPAPPEFKNLARFSSPLPSAIEQQSLF